MAKKIQLSIADPCHENWDAMTPADKGKFCGSCQKQVIDFSTMSDRQIAEFFKKPSTGSVCGRFMTDQLDRAIEIPKKRIPWVKYFFQIALPAFLVSLKASASAKQGKIKVNTVATDTTKKPQYDILQNVTMGDTITRPITVKGEIAATSPVCNPENLMVAGGISIAQVNTNELEGVVIDQNGQPILYATIETGKKGKALTADEFGNFKIKKSWLDKSTELTISSAGFETKKMIVSKNYVGQLVIQLNANVVLPEVTLMSSSMGLIKKGYVTGYSVSKIADTVLAKSSNVTEPKISDPAFRGRDMFVYPNPIAIGSSLNINLKKPEEGYHTLQLINPNGQVLLQKEVWIDTEARILNTEVPVVAAGSYFMILTNKKTGKKYSEKIIIQ